MRAFTPALFLVALAALVVTAVALGSGAGAAHGTRIQVKLKEMSVIPALKSTKAGDVTFVISNVGTVDHEFVVQRHDTVGLLPVKNFKAVEDDALHVDEVEDIVPGAAPRNLSVQLKKGRYILFCNVPGHYQLGMSIAFRVT